MARRVVASLTATGIIFGIELSWVFPNTPNIIERTELRYAQVDDFNQAVLLGEFSYPTNRHTLLNLSAGARLWFWARLIDKNGTPGDWYPAAGGVMGQASADAAGYLGYFDGLIGKDQLAEGMLEEIKTEVGQGIAEEVFEEVIGEMSGDDEIYSGDTTVFAGTLSVLKSIASGDLALTQRIDAQVSRIDENYAAIREEEITRATQTESLAQQTALLAAQTAVNEAAVQATTTALASLDGALEATYTLRAEVTSGGQMYAAGMALGVYAQPGQPVQSSFYVLADRFAILNLTNGIATTPFVIQGGQAFINQALIGDGWITNAMIGNVIQSNNFVSNSAGSWHYDSSLSRQQKAYERQVSRLEADVSRERGINRQKLEVLAQDMDEISDALGRLLSVAEEASQTAKTAATTARTAATTAQGAAKNAAQANIKITEVKPVKNMRLE